MKRVNRNELHPTACIARSRAIKNPVLSAIVYASILVLVLAESVVVTVTAMAGPISTPTGAPTVAATPTPTEAGPQPPPAILSPTPTENSGLDIPQPIATPIATPTSSPTSSSKTTPDFDGASSYGSPSASVTSGGPLTVGKNVNVSQLEGNHQEVAIAIDPTNPRRLFLFSNTELDNGGLFAAYSQDAGVNWSKVGGSADGIMADGNDSLPVALGDPSASWDEFGNLFITYLTTSAKAAVALSIDGGQTFEKSWTLGQLIDQPTIATGSIFDGVSSVWVTYKDYGISNDRLAVHKATVTALGKDNVGSFSGQILIGNYLATEYCYTNDIAVGPPDEFGEYAVLEVCQYGYSTPNEIRASYTLALDPHSSEEGYINSFSEPATVVQTNVNVYEEIDAQEERGIGAEPGIAYDRNPSSAYFGRVYLVYTDEKFGPSGEDRDDTDIYVVFSDDNGITWSPDLATPIPPVRVNDDRDADETNKSQFLPRIAVDQTYSDVAVSWHDCRNDTEGGNPTALPPDPDGPNNDAQLYASMSTDGGISFHANVPVSWGTSDEDAAEPFTGDCCYDLDYGDFTGLAFVDGNFYPAWADNSNSTGDNPSGAMDVYTARVLPEPGQLIVLNSGIMSLLGLSFLRVRNGRREN